MPVSCGTTLAHRHHITVWNTGITWKKIWTWKMEGFWDNTQDCNFINHWTTKVGLKKPKCTMQTVVMCKSTVLWCMSNDLQYIDEKKRIFLQFVRRGEFHMGWMWHSGRAHEISTFVVEKKGKKMRQQYRYSNNMSSQLYDSPPFYFAGHFPSSALLPRRLSSLRRGCVSPWKDRWSKNRWELTTFRRSILEKKNLDQLIE